MLQEDSLELISRAKRITYALAKGCSALLATFLTGIFLLANCVTWFWLVLSAGLSFGSIYVALILFSALSLSSWTLIFTFVNKVTSRNPRILWVWYVVPLVLLALSIAEIWLMYQLWNLICPNCYFG